MSKRKQKKGSSQTRELFSDDLTQVETQTTGQPPYLEDRPVKFSNVPVGGRFLLDGSHWTKSTPEFASPDSDTYSVSKIAPETLVFLIGDSSK